MREKNPHSYIKKAINPWFARQRWMEVKGLYGSIRFEHSFREANFAADAMAKRGCLLEDGVGFHFEGRPVFLSSIEFPNVIYYRFK